MGGETLPPSSQEGKRKWAQMQMLATLPAKRQGLWSTGFCFSIREGHLLRAEVGEQQGRYQIIITRCEKANTGRTSGLPGSVECASVIVCDDIRPVHLVM